MWLISLRDLQWRQRRFVVAVVATGLVFGMSLLMAGTTYTFYEDGRRIVRSFGAAGTAGLDAVFGETPGYRDLVGREAPDRVGDFGEWLARKWVRRFADPEVPDVGPVGRTTINDPAGRTRHEIDVWRWPTGRPTRRRRTRRPRPPLRRVTPAADTWLRPAEAGRWC